LITQKLYAQRYVALVPENGTPTMVTMTTIKCEIRKIRSNTYSRILPRVNKSTANDTNFRNDTTALLFSLLC